MISMAMEMMVWRLTFDISSMRAWSRDLMGVSELCFCSARTPWDDGPHGDTDEGSDSTEGTADAQSRDVATTGPPPVTKSTPHSDVRLGDGPVRDHACICTAFLTPSARMP